jgi:dihydroceramidase
MLFFGGCILQALYTSGQTRTTTAFITAATTAGTLAASIMYIRSGNIFHHFAAFSAMVHLIWSRMWYLILFPSRPKAEMAALLRRFWKAAGLLVVAFVVWNIDLEKCFELRDMRSNIGLPWAWLLELHGWWYVLPLCGA